MTGTIRTLKPETRELVHKRIRDICRGLEEAFMCKIDVDILLGYPAVINDAEFIEKYAVPAANKIDVSADGEISGLF